MSSFSERMKYKPSQVVQYKSVNDKLRNRIWNLFYRDDIMRGGLASERISGAFNGQATIEDIIWDKLGFSFELNKLSNYKLIEIKKYLTHCTWNEVYDFIEIHINSVNEKYRDERIKDYNTLLEEEKSAYRFVKGIVSPITDESEIEEIEKAGKTHFESVNKHIEKAIAYYSDIESPDYENSIKESISAVEAICCIITGTDGKQSSLGNTLKKLKENGVRIHSSMEKAFSSLYGYTSDENGIRHGGIDFKNAPSEDAKFMLVTCSAFINYLIEKKSRIEGENYEL